MINYTRFGFPSARTQTLGGKHLSYFPRLICTILICLLTVSSVFAGEGVNRAKHTEERAGYAYNAVNLTVGSGVDVGILKSTDKATAAVGDIVTFTLQVYNTGVNDAHNVVVKDLVPFGTNFVSATPSSLFNSVTGFWTCGTIPAGDTLAFLLRVQITNSTAVTSQAEVFSMTEADDDSFPNNGLLNEDDWASTITHIPLFFCNKEEIAVEVMAPPGCNSYKWFRYGMLVSTDSIYTITNFGSYHYQALYGLNNDTITLCCPIEVKPKCITMGDVVWKDSDNNGKRDFNEPGLDKVELELFNAGDNGIDSTDIKVATVTTDAQGNFAFMNIGPGNYYIVIPGKGVPAGYISSTGDGLADDDGAGPYEPGQNGINPDEDCGTQVGAAVYSGLFNLEYDKQPVNDDGDPNTNYNVDFGFYKPVVPPASISGIAFLDCGKDGLSSGDAPMPGITVTLIKGNTSTTQVTDSSGSYSFDNLKHGNYRIVFSRPASLNFTNQNVGSDDSIDSDVDPLTGSTGDFNLSKGESVKYDAGYQDYTAPVFVSTSEAQDLNAECDEVPQPAILSATDNYDTNVNIIFREDRQAGNCLDNYVITRTWVAVDDCGNTAQHVQRIVVRDTKAPVFAAYPQIADITVECDQVPLPETGFSAADNCDNRVDILFNEERIDGSCSGNYTLLRTWTAIDNCSNASTKIQVIKVYDRTAPQFNTILTDLQVSCNNVPNLPQIGASDNCDKDVEISFCEKIKLGTCSDNYFITRTWVASDDCGNTTQMIQNITVRDVEAPVFSNAPYSVTINCGQNTGQMPTVTDNCDSNVAVSVSETQASGDCTTGRTITRVYTATDNCGNVSQFTQTIHVIDNEAPQIVNTPSNVTVNCGSIPPPAKITVKDNCPDAVMIMFDEQKSAGDNCSGFTITRTWTAMDACGNQTVFTQIVVVEGDHNAPVISGVPADTEYDCADVVPYPAMVVATDDCDNNPKLIFTEDKLGLGCGYKLIRSWTATDKCGNVSTKLQAIIVRDKTAPLISGVPADVTVECSDALPSKANPVAVDACDNGAILSYSQTIQGDVNSCAYLVLRTWTATDKCGNVASKTQIITVKDSRGPVITPLNPALAGISNGDTMTVECDRLIVMDENDVVVSDNCDSIPTVKFDEYGIEKGNCPSDGYLYLLNCRWTATDKCGNTSIYEFTLRVIDNTAPVFSNVPASVTIDCSQTMPALVAPAVSDNCDKNVQVTYSENIVKGRCEGSLTITRRWTATDHCGNVSTATQSITIDDNIPPVISNVPQGATVNCGDTADDSIRPFVTDNCDKYPTLTYNDGISGSGGCLGTVIRTWTATDACGNVTTATQSILIIDNVAPVINVNTSSLVLDCGQPIPDTPASVSDNCDANPVLNFRETRLGDDCDFKIIREWSAKDKCGNETIKVKTITVHDKTAPLISGVPADYTVNCTDPRTPADLTVTDICDKNPQVSMLDKIVGDSTACQYLVIRTWTATDKCGNSTTMSVQITVRDLTAPVIVPKNPMIAGLPNGGTLTVECDQVQLMDENDVLVTDDCDNNPHVKFDEYGVRKGDCPVDGYLYLLNCRWTATDKCGNTSVYEFTLKVIDSHAPVFSNVPQSVTISCDQGLPPLTTPEVTDNCDKNVIVVYTENVARGNCEGNAVISRKWTATDHCGNVSTATQTITIQDNVAPVISNVSQSLTVNCGDVADASVRPVVSDNCDKNPVLSYKDSISTSGGCQGSVIRIWTATDACGNSSTAIQTILIIDNQAPEILVNTTSLVLDCGQPVPDTPASVTDNCDTNPELKFRETRFGDDCNFKIVREWIATDNCGNETIKVKTITVHDTTPPVISGVPADFTTNCSDPLTPPAVTVADICDKNPQISMSDLVVGDTNSCQYKVVRTWTATDKCGNSISHSMTITVKDLSAPVIVPKSPMLAGVPSGSTITVECDQLQVMTENDVIVTDDCDKKPLVKFEEYDAKIGDCQKDGYVLTITCRWTATDKCGNTSIYVFTVVAKDTKAPALSGVPDNITLDCKGSLPAVPQVTAVDNCTKDVNVVYSSTPYVGGTCVLSGSVVRSWTATDDCGNSTVKTQLIIFTDNQKPLIIGTVADVTLNPGETEPQYAVKAVDNCDTDVDLQLSSSKVDSTCFEVTVYTYTATDDCGNVSQLKYTVTKLKYVNLLANINVSTSDEICGGKNGTAKLSPATYTYTWNDGFVGTERYNLSAGQYVVTVSDGCASKVITVVIGSECPCIVPEIVSTSITPAVCGGSASGSISFGMKDGSISDYVFVWNTARGLNNKADSIGAGDYSVVISRRSNPNCFSKFNFSVPCNPLPPVCSSFISSKSETLFGPCGFNARLCIPDLPFADISTYSILDNGAPYAGSISKCNVGTGLTLTVGNHQLIFTNKDGCKDTVAVRVACTSAKYIVETIEVNQKDTVCLDVSELLGKLSSVVNIWPSQSGAHARFDLVNGSSCITCLGVNAGGTDRAAFVISDEYGVHDTTFFEITVIEKNSKGPDAIEDRAKMKQGEVMVLDVLANDQLGSAPLTEIKIVRQPKNAFVFMNPENKVVFTPSADFCDDSEDESFTYKICTREGCDEAPVLIKVQCSGIKIYTGFSPNGDGVNDTFVIDGALEQSNNKLSVFNRYGNQVYFKEGYRNDWNGTWEGKNLPDGTYYYLFEDGKGENMAGYLQILR